MRRTLPCVIMIVCLLMPSCSVVSGRSTKVVKPKYHHWWFGKHWWFSKKKDKKAKRTRVVRMKS